MRYGLILFALLSNAAHADPSVVERVSVAPGTSGLTVSVTLSHADTGWDDYADGWRVETDAGDVLGTRVLHHPHVEEQPFTRSLSGVALPEGIEVIFIRARTNVEGWDSARFGPFAVGRR